MTGTPAAGVAPDDLRGAARCFASGVTVAAASHGGLHHAITATAFCSLSLEPPLVLLAVRSTSRLLGLVEASGAIGISVLGAHQRHVGEWAATPDRAPVRTLPLHATRTAVTGAPLVPDSVAWFDCRVRALSAQGDHSLVVGLVVAAGGRIDGGGAEGDGDDPLLYFRGRYHAIGAVLTPAADPEAIGDCLAGQEIEVESAEGP